MSDVLNDKEKGEEARYKLSEEQHFKADAKRNKLLGLWAAEQLGYGSDKAEQYAKEVVLADLEEPGVEDVLRKILGDFALAGIELSAQDVRKELDRFQAQAWQQVTDEFPEPLGKDHARVGDADY